MKPKNLINKTTWLNLYLSLGVLATICLVSTSPALAYKISKIRGPGTLKLPNNGQLNSLVVILEGIYTSGDFDQNNRSLEGGLWADTETKDPIGFSEPIAIDLQPEGAVLPPPSPNATRGSGWATKVTFRIGCTEEGIIFGPSGITSDRELRLYVVFHNQRDGVFGGYRKQQWRGLSVKCTK